MKTITYLVVCDKTIHHNVIHSQFYNFFSQSNKNNLIFSSFFLIQSQPQVFDFYMLLLMVAGAR